MAARNIATIPCGVAFNSKEDRDAAVQTPVNYGKDRIQHWAGGNSVTTTDGATFSTDTHGGSEETSAGGNIYDGELGNGLWFYRYGGYGGTGVTRIAASGYSGGTALDNSIWDTGSTSTHLPWVVGMSWKWWNGKGADMTPSHSGSYSAYPNKVALIYTDKNRNMSSYNLAVKTRSGSSTLGSSPGSSYGTDGAYYCYNVSDTPWRTITDQVTPLFYMGMIVQWTLNHGVGNQTLAGTLWNAVPLIAYSSSPGDGFYDSLIGHRNKFMCVKDAQTVTSSLASNDLKAFALQPPVS